MMVTLPTPASGNTLRLDIDSKGWTRVTLLDSSERSLGAESAYNLLSRLLAALSDPAQVTMNFGDGEITPVVSLWEDHHTIWVERLGGGATALRIQEDTPGTIFAATVTLDSSERDLWRVALVGLLIRASADEVLF